MSQLKIADRPNKILPKQQIPFSKIRDEHERKYHPKGMMVEIFGGNKKEQDIRIYCHTCKKNILIIPRTKKQVRKVFKKKVKTFYPKKSSLDRLKEKGVITWS